MIAERLKVLCVDDEAMVLAGLSLHLRRGFEVVTATSGAAGLAAIGNQGPFAVILTDMRMPGMDGATFLASARAVAPDATRMLLTGHADTDAAMAAVNRGQVFRFLAKPCQPEALLEAFAAAAEHHRLVVAERNLLEQTLRGAVKALTEVLSIASPICFGRAARLQRRAGELAMELHLPDRWQIEVAAMLSQLGWISVPEETINRHADGKQLEPAELAMIAKVPEVTEGLLASIPRLETVREMLAQLAHPPAPPKKDVLAKKDAPAQKDGSSQKDGPASKEVQPEPFVAQAVAVLRLAADFDALETAGERPRIAIDTLRGRGGHDPALVEALSRLCAAAGKKTEIRELPLAALQVDMVLADGVRTRTGVLLVSRGNQVTQALLRRLSHYPRGSVQEPVRVAVTLKHLEALDKKA